MINKDGRDQLHTIGPGDRMQLWWPSAAQHVWVTVLDTALDYQPRHGGGHYLAGATFTVYTPHSYVYEASGHQRQVKRVAVIYARRYSDDVREAYTPEPPFLSAEEHVNLLAYHAEHGGPERNCVVPDEVLTGCPTRA